MGEVHVIIEMFYTSITLCSLPSKRLDILRFIYDMPNILLVFRIRGIAKPPEAKKPASSPTMQTDAAMASPIEAYGRKSRFDAVEKMGRKPQNR